MGVDTVIRLTPQAQVGNVAEAIGILLGEPWKWEAQHRWLEVENVKVKGNEDMPETASIFIGNPIKLTWWYCFECSYGNWRAMYPRSDARAIAIGRALVGLFGGEVDYQAYDSSHCDYRKPAPSWLLGKYSDKKFHAKYTAMSELKPLTIEDLHKVASYAAYDHIEL